MLSVTVQFAGQEEFTGLEECAVACFGFSGENTAFAKGLTEDFLIMTKNMNSKVLLIVKCPNCLSLLPESTDVPVYACGGCGAILLAKKRNNSKVDTTSQTFVFSVDQEAGSSSNQQSDQNSDATNIDLHSSNKDQDAAKRAENGTVDGPRSAVEEYSYENLKMKQLCADNQPSLVNPNDEPDQNSEFSGDEDAGNQQEDVGFENSLGKQKIEQLSDDNRTGSSLAELQKLAKELNHSNDPNVHRRIAIARKIVAESMRLRRQKDEKPRYSSPMIPKYPGMEGLKIQVRELRDQIETAQRLVMLHFEQPKAFSSEEKRQDDNPPVSGSSNPKRNHLESDVSASDDCWQRNGVTKQKERYARPIADGSRRSQHVTCAPSFLSRLKAFFFSAKDTRV
ncbi:hypothetical protein SSX86_018179 [Deinandra increscens subsp. villosa]|uniref:Enhanced disease resistance 4-like N-terminal domain-containing protein n=1 Tax=Deinandra increscens subsp. villosa TaxID=3103831 RepID=A0AAP0CXC9_9ASTR